MGDKPSSMSKLGRMRPPVSRVLSLDAGTRSIKMLLAESDFGRLRIAKEEFLDLQEEGLLSADEIKTHLHAVIEEWGRPPVALVLPQHVSISQVIDLPSAPESEVEKMIREETLKLGGVSETRIIYDFVRTEIPGKQRQQFWVTLCQEGDIRERINRHGLEHDDLCEVTTTANALMAAFRHAAPDAARTVLIHLGAQSTLVMVLLAGQGAYAASFPMGGDFFTRALARQRNISEDAAEALKRSKNLLAAPDADVAFAGTVDGWVTELSQQLREWFDRNAGTEISTFDFIASGAGFDQPGLVEYLKASAGLELKPWPQPANAGSPSPAKHFEAAFGAALQALGHSAQPVSLLPEDFRVAWQKRLNRQKLEFASFVLVGLCVLLLAMGTWHKLSIINRKETLLREVMNGQEAFDANEALASRLQSDYENLRPFFAGQQNSLDTINSLRLLQQTRTNKTFWYVLVADQQSYFSLPPAITTTNRLARTNATAVVEKSLTELLSGAAFIGTNGGLARPGLIAEMDVPEEPEASRQTLSQLVRELKMQPLFSKVDLLADDLRRNIADPKLVLPGKDFVISMDFATTDFSSWARTPRRGTSPGHGPGRHGARPAGPATQDEGGAGP